jgi:hypothetical protein
MCFAYNPYSLVLILCIPAYLEIKGDQSFSDLRNFFGGFFYVPNGVLQFVSGDHFYAKLNVTNLYVTNLYWFYYKLI